MSIEKNSIGDRIKFKRAVAQKNGDGSYTVRVFSAFDKSTDVLFPMDPFGELLALEYTNFKNAQAESGPLSPATQAVVSDAKAMSSNDLHEQLMAKVASLSPVPSGKVVMDPNAEEISQSMKDKNE